MSVTSQRNPELYDILKRNAELNTGRIGKFGSGKVIIRSIALGQKYETVGIWDYNTGVQWKNLIWEKVDLYTNECPCCGHIKEE